MTLANFNTEYRAAEPVGIDWADRVARHLDRLPPGDPARDWAILQDTAMGRPCRDTARAKALWDATRDPYGNANLDGRAALIKLARERAGA